MLEAPTDRAGHDERWIEVPAPRGGIWMVAIRERDGLVIAPPAVALLPADNSEAVDRWRLAEWPLDDHGWLARKPDQLTPAHVLTTADVLALLPKIHRSWVAEVMRLQLAQREAFATPQAGGLSDEERSRRSAQKLHDLRSELQVAFPDEDWYTPAIDDLPCVPDTDVNLLAAIDGRRRDGSAELRKQTLTLLKPYAGATAKDEPRQRSAGARVLIVANRTAAGEKLLEAVRQRAHAGPPVTFHLLVPATPRGLHRTVDPEIAGRQEATAQLEHALEHLREAAGADVTGHVGDANPMGAISDTLHEREVDEIIISTLPRRLSRWMRVDLPSKVRELGLGIPVTHVEAVRTRTEEQIGERHGGSAA